MRAMPLYIYSCPSFGITVEELRPASRADDPLACSVCGTPCVRGVTNFFVSAGRKEKDPTRRKPAHPPGCPCCTVRRPQTAPKTGTIDKQ
jgi:putative FmdB family regulatory protein